MEKHFNKITIEIINLDANHYGIPLARIHIKDLDAYINKSVRALIIDELATVLELMHGECYIGIDIHVVGEISFYKHIRKSMSLDLTDHKFKARIKSELKKYIPRIKLSR